MLRVARHTNLSGLGCTLINRGISVTSPASLPHVEHPVAITATPRTRFRLRDPRAN
jgi:hypothetical protein